MPPPPPPPPDPIGPRPLARLASEYNRLADRIEEIHVELNQLRLEHKQISREYVAAHLAELPADQFYEAVHRGVRYGFAPHVDRKGIRRIRIGLVEAGGAIA